MGSGSCLSCTSGSAFESSDPWTGSGRVGKQLFCMGGVRAGNLGKSSGGGDGRLSDCVLARAEGPVQQADPELAELVSSHLAWEQAMADSKPAWHPVRPGHLVVIGIPTAWRICQQQRRHLTWKWEYPDAEQCPQQDWAV